jgi:hypothetical protein
MTQVQEAGTAATSRGSRSLIDWHCHDGAATALAVEGSGNVGARDYTQHTLAVGMRSQMLRLLVM